jgi:hypothetical protein
MVFLTARRPSRTASRVCSTAWLVGPLMSTVHEVGLVTPSTKVNFSSPSTCSYTCSALPRSLGCSPSSELTAWPPHASVTRSMLRRLARRSPRMPSLASMSSAGGSIP